MRHSKTFIIFLALTALILISGFQAPNGCQPEQPGYDVEYYDQVSKWITQFGGHLNLAEGVVLYFGQNSLDHLTKITGQVAKITDRATGEVSFAFDLSPHGIEFNRQAYILIDVSYFGENFNPEDVASYLWLEDSTTEENWSDANEVKVKTMPDGTTMLVIPLNHFSSYAIGKQAPDYRPQDIFMPKGY
jgi:hypothetical protein